MRRIAAALVIAAVLSGTGLAAPLAAAQEAPQQQPEPESVNGKPGENPIANAVRLMIEATAEQEKARPLAEVRYSAMKSGGVVRFEREGQPTLYRLRTGGFADVAAAQAFCEQARAKQMPCAVIR